MYVTSGGSNIEPPGYGCMVSGSALIVFGN